MRNYRMRIELDDRPGALGVVASALGQIGINIIDLDVHSDPGSARTDDVVASFTLPLDLPAVEHAVTGAGAALVELSAIDSHEMRDRTTMALELAASVACSQGADLEVLCEAARSLVRAELVWATGGGMPRDEDDVVSRVLATDSPAQVNKPVKRLPNGDGPTWSLAVPVGRADGGVQVIVLARRGPRFSYTETARVQALLRLHTATAPTPGATDVRLSDGGSAAVRQLHAHDLDALVRLHARCSRESLYRRYFSPMPNPARAFLRRLIDVDGTTRFGFVAMVGDEIVGITQAFRTRTGDFEVAFLVEDRHQRRGIGSALFDQLATQLLATDVREAYALTLPDNDGLRRLMARAAKRSTVWDGGLLRITVGLVKTSTDADVRARSPLA